MFENMTYENILAGMLARVAAPVDKREGSLLWDALAPAAFELARLYTALQQVLQEGFADTASRQYLILRAREQGIAPRPASAAIALARIEAEPALPPGSRFCCGDYNWQVTEQLGENLYQLVCEEVGSGPNLCSGRLTPLAYLSGLRLAELERIVAPGEDEEDTEALRARYLKALVDQSFGGNAADYIAKAGGIAGVGAVKVQAAWQGGGTVRLLLLDDNLGVPDAVLVRRVQEIFDPASEPGAGLGLAPIGHVVTAAPAVARPVAVALQVTLREGWLPGDINTAVQGCVDAYFVELCRRWAAEKQLTVRLSQLEARILNLGGVLDVSGLTLAGRSANLVLQPEEIPVRGQVNVS